jgi:hypothetical protein
MDAHIGTGRCAMARRNVGNPNIQKAAKAAPTVVTDGLAKL